MKPVARIINDWASLASLDIPRERTIFDQHRRRIPGWTEYTQFLFFAAVLAELFREVRTPRILICGVYHGLDLALIANIALRLGRAIDLHGVDLFSAEPCADWPPGKRGMTWEQAFGCPPPSIEAARRNCPSALISQHSAETFIDCHLGVADRAFDFIYLDTSHDEKTVRGEIIAAKRRTYGAILAGDDYTGPDSFNNGVESAVNALLPDHNVLFNRTWIAQL